jgi:hypothetical protein
MNASKEIIETYETLEDKYQQYVKAYTSLDSNSVDSLLEKLPTHHAFFGGVYAYARSLYDQSVAAVERVEAELKIKFRNQLLTEGKKATVDATTSEVLASPEFQSVKAASEKAQYKMLLAKNLLNSLEYARDMLIQISANRRNESKLI